MDFIVGQPRSGTAFFTHLLNGCGEIVCLHQNLYTLTCYQIAPAACAYYEGRRTDGEIKSLIAMYGLRPDVRIDSSWISAWMLGPLIEAHPEARFVHLVRDPRENVRSCLNEHDLYGAIFSRQSSREAFMRWCVRRNRPWVYVLMQEMLLNLPRLRHENWDTMSALERNCAFWTEGHRQMLDHLSSRSSTLIVRLEDISRDDCFVQVFDFLGLPVPSRHKWDSLRSTRVNSKQDEIWTFIRQMKQDLGMELLPDYGDWPQETKDVLKRYCGPMAARFGYHIA